MIIVEDKNVYRCSLLYSTLITTPRYFLQLPLSYYLFNALLLLLQLLHIVWSYMIVQSLWIGWKGGMVPIDWFIARLNFYGFDYPNTMIVIYAGRFWPVLTNTAIYMLYSIIFIGSYEAYLRCAWAILIENWCILRSDTRSDLVEYKR